MKQHKGYSRPRRWATYEAGKSEIARRVAVSGKEGAEGARLYEQLIKRHAARLRV